MLEGSLEVPLSTNHAGELKVIRALTIMQACSLHQFTLFSLFCGASTVKDFDTAARTMPKLESSEEQLLIYVFECVSVCSRCFLN